MKPIVLFSHKKRDMMTRDVYLKHIHCIHKLAYCYIKQNVKIITLPEPHSVSRLKKLLRLEASV